jgi:membrane associated rhomboid family serine protease
MQNTQGFRQRPSFVPKVIKTTLGLTLTLTFLSLISNALFTQVLGIPSLQQLLSLSLWGIHQWFFWQFLSYLFIQPLSTGINFGLLLHIFFDLYLLWMIGSAIVQLKGDKHFISLYFGGGIFVGLISYLCQLFFHVSLPFAGATPAIYILLISWNFLFPSASLMLFMMIPMRAKWVVFGLIGINLFLDFSNGNFFGFFITASSLVFGYLYAVLSWETVSPFPRLHRLDHFLIALKKKILSSFQKETSYQLERGKIYDFKTGQVIVQDDAFVDACLEKIAKYGKRSLSWRERWKLRRVSKKLK